MTESDLDWVCAAEADLHLFPWTRGNFIDSIALKSVYANWVMYRDKTPLGYAVLLYVLDEVHLLNISIVRHAHGQGYGAVFLDYLFEQSRQRGSVSFFLEVRPSNVVAHSLYCRQGFEQIGIRKGYYQAVGGREDAIVMRKALS